MDHSYIRRTLHFIDDGGQTRRIDESELANIRKPIAILAEPGMGKTWLLRRLAELPNYVFRSAASFVAHPRPADLVPAGATLLVDGLDELSAAQESDPIYRLLGKLIEAGCPSFILTCRAADWRGAVARQDIADDYGVPPLQMWLEPFSRSDAVDFLSRELGPMRADALITTLDERGLPDLYGNPLTLELFGAVATENETLPTTRAELLQRATRLLWRETNDRKQGSALSNLDGSTAIDAAGALSAAFVLTGSEAIALNPSSALTAATLPIAEVGQLPRAAQARALLGSRLFAPIRAPMIDLSQFTALSRSSSVHNGSPLRRRTTLPATVCWPRFPLTRASQPHCAALMLGWHAILVSHNGSSTQTLTVSCVMAMQMASPSTRGGSFFWP